MFIKKLLKVSKILLYFGMVVILFNMVVMDVYDFIKVFMFRLIVEVGLVMFLMLVFLLEVLFVVFCFVI